MTPVRTFTTLLAAVVVSVMVYSVENAQAEPEPGNIGPPSGVAAGTHGPSETEVYAAITYEDGTKVPVPGATYNPNKSLKDMIAKEGSQGSEVHPVPDVPVIVDGVYYEDPTVLNELFAGEKLRYIADEKAAKEGVVYVFSTDEGYLAYIEKYWGIDPDKPFGSSTSDTIITDRP